MKNYLSLSCLLFMANFGVIASDYKPLVNEDEADKQIKIFAKEVALAHQFDEQQIIHLLSNQKHNPQIIKKMTRPAESVMPWFKYRKIWMKDKRINEGVEFWQKHQKTLIEAQQKYGVDPAIIVAIIGVETFYGKIQGSYPVLEALHTLAFYYPPRAKFFRSELAEYLLLARKEGWEHSKIKGSYAGAMGMGQFISSSYSHYAVDFNGDGKINLFSDPVDMIGSVANYFNKHHWRTSGFVAKAVDLNESQKQLVQSQLAPSLSLAQLQKNSLDITQLVDKTETAGIYAFEQATGKLSYWLGGENFYVITRYNHSAMYALAVFQLSEAIKQKRDQ